MKEALDFDSVIDAEYEKPAEVMQAGTVLDLDIIRPRFDDYRTEAVALKNVATALTVNDQTTLEYAVALGGNAKKIGKKIDADRKKVIEEPQDFVKGVNAICKVITDQLDEAEATVKEKIRVHNARIEMERRERERKAKEETEALQRRLDAEAAEANRKAAEEARKRAEEEMRIKREKEEAEARERGAKRAELDRLAKKAEEERLEAIRKAEEEAKKNEVVAPTVVAPVVQEAAKVTRTESGSASQRKNWVFEVVNEAEVPREYLVVDHQKIRDSVRMGTRSIPGVRIYEATTTVFRS